MFEKYKRTVEGAEAELGRLSRGMRSDLLLDNHPEIHDSAEAKRILDAAYGPMYHRLDGHVQDPIERLRDEDYLQFVADAMAEGRRIAPYLMQVIDDCVDDGGGLDAYEVY